MSHKLVLEYLLTLNSSRPSSLVNNCTLACSYNLQSIKKCLTDSRMFDTIHHCPPPTMVTMMRLWIAALFTIVQQFTLEWVWKFFFKIEARLNDLPHCAHLFGFSTERMINCFLKSTGQLQRCCYFGKYKTDLRRNTKNISWEMKSQIFLSLADDETPNTSSDSESVTLSEKEMQNGKQNKSKAHTMTNPSMQKLWEIFHLLLRHQRRRMSSTAVHPSMEFLMQLLVVGLFLVLLLYLYLAFTTINFLLWLCNLQVLKDLNPNSAGLFCRNVCQLVSSDGLPHPLRRWHRQTAPILDKYFCKVHDSLWKSSCRLSSSPAQDLVASKITC